MLPGGARLMIGFHGLDASPALRAHLEATGARGVILYARNIRSAGQTRELIEAIRALVPWPLLVAVDQEGGPVVRVHRGATLFPGNMALGAADRVDLAARQGAESGRQLAAMGFDLNLAPVIDLQTNPLNPGIGIRSLGADPERARALAEALVRGHREAGVHSCLKHFPGKGAASVDAHRDLPVLDLPLETFRDPHLRIFEELLARLEPAPAIMTSHVVVTGLDAELPATLSTKVTRRLLREELGFDGLLLTDDLEMGAIVKHLGVGPAAEAAARAGHDLILVCHEPERQLEAAGALELALAEGRLDTDEHARAVARIEESARWAEASRRASGEDARARALRDSRAGDGVAIEIARAAVHVFGDRRALLPLRPTDRCGVVAFRPRAIVDVEETQASEASELGGAPTAPSSPGSFEDALRRSLESSAIRADPVLVLESSEAAPSETLDALRGVDRVLFYGWDALRQPAVRSLLDALLARFAERLIVLHLRNPFDQTLLADDVTSLTAFGYHPCQLDALGRVLSGAASASGSLPAPLRAVGS